MSLFWLSFVEVGESAPAGGKFLGVAIVRADWPVGAAARAHDLGINPGGEVQIYGPLDDDAFPSEYVERDTLLTAEEARTL